MNEKKDVCILHPFESELPFSVTGQLLVLDKGLEAAFFLKDPTNRVKKPKPVASPSPERANDLWKTTCFELFLSQAGSSDYYEINLSPDGKWNAYYFKSYRTPQPPAESTEISLQKIRWSEDTLRATFDFKNKNLLNLQWDCSMTAVIETNSNQKFYFATSHEGEKPDFHLRKSFKLKRGSTL